MQLYSCIYTYLAFIHIYEVKSISIHFFLQADLWHCIDQRVPMLLNRGRIKLIVLDSIAALFRCEYSVRETVKRAKQLTSFGARLHQLSCQHAVPIICVNQVSNGSIRLKMTFNLFLPGDLIDKCCLNLH